MFLLGLCKIKLLKLPNAKAIETARAEDGSHTHRGIAQWDYSDDPNKDTRWKHLESFAAARGLDVYDIRTQALFIDYERKQGNESVYNADIYSIA